jgi:hypothetical protein
LKRQAFSQVAVAKQFVIAGNENGLAEVRAVSDAQRQLERARRRGGLRARGFCFLLHVFKGQSLDSTEPASICGLVFERHFSGLKKSASLGSSCHSNRRKDRKKTPMLQGKIPPDFSLRPLQFHDIPH